MASSPSRYDHLYTEGMGWLDDLSRCDGYNPCGDCCRCVARPRCGDCAACARDGEVSEAVDVDDPLEVED